MSRRRLELRGTSTKDRLSHLATRGVRDLEDLDGTAIADAARCTCGVLVIRGAKISACPKCDRRMCEEGRSG